METSDLADHTNVAAALLSAMANPKRLLILCSLVKGEVAVGVLATQVGLSQSALSQHLSKLRAHEVPPYRSLPTLERAPRTSNELGSRAVIESSASR